MTIEIATGYENKIIDTADGIEVRSVNTNRLTKLLVGKDADDFRQTCHNLQNENFMVPDIASAVDLIATAA